MTLYVDTRGQLKAWRQPMAYIKAMFHRVSVEHKSTAIGTAVNVPRNAPRGKEWQTTSQAHDSSPRFKRAFTLPALHT